MAEVDDERVRGDGERCAAAEADGTGANDDGGRRAGQQAQTVTRHGGAATATATASTIERAGRPTRGKKSARKRQQQRTLGEQEFGAAAEAEIGASLITVKEIEEEEGFGAPIQIPLPRGNRNQQERTEATQVIDRREGRAMKLETCNINCHDSNRLA
ncbi:hypothetical protein Taro_001946 [Colocasia esculenta]|uniref:Uncharacterized protein n=1 Tax=Colocasia esculenta TaxID=4460 RepID=A0A843TF26_COLES|nr:hypothetical protein [Colocasia esculenta]